MLNTNADFRNCPTYQMPPAAVDLSKTVTFRPARCKWAADTTPLIPAPMMATRAETLVILEC
jgi:hypothetical protein